ncbi:cation efflux protein, CzcI family [Pelomonas cellulosilytica]|uniref:Cobalt-zinc-cadmium resistance protein n=1 Tax=Pelomonas cellulosilytica TaxID=2906762 RepID=A0ABS8XW08_9BURK|nr:cation efflux protein, CzcI family [Pelomonas sp. P8]MCE4555072.1 cobalt-zinc-cadmium resistance protein [Pelomonas sp. P8]
MLLRSFHRLTVTFLVMLSLLLPLQVAWGSAAAYCEHETTTEASKHFGHHQHEHKGSSHDVSAKKSTVKKAVVDNDCAACHMSSSAIACVAAEGVSAPGLSSDLVPRTSGAHESALARAPDRPQWRRLA